METFDLKSILTMTVRGYAVGRSIAILFSCLKDSSKQKRNAKN